MNSTPRHPFRLIAAFTACWAVALAGCGQVTTKPTAASTSAQQKEQKHMSQNDDPAIDDKVERTDAEWRQILTPEQYRILREKGTEGAFTGKYWNTKTPGTYKCAGCGETLFVSDTKFDSGCGWPSFFAPADEKVIDEHLDTSYGMVRTEVTCSRCGGHLGHVFEDGPRDKGGLRYCINSASIEHQPQSDASPTDQGADQSSNTEKK